MLHRNIDTSKGLSNGVRLVITRMFNLFIDIEILTGGSEGKMVFIPKMAIIPSDTDLSISFSPGAIHYSLSICHDDLNKSQGKTFDKVNIHLNRECFSRGQLYVAFSRVHSHKDIFVKMEETTDQGKHIIL